MPKLTREQKEVEINPNAGSLVFKEVDGKTVISELIFRCNNKGVENVPSRLRLDEETIAKVLGSKTKTFLSNFDLLFTSAIDEINKEETEQ